MSETAGTSKEAQPIAAAQPVAERTALGRQAPPPHDDAVHEAYAFACMRCGHGWERSYEIRHQRDTDGVMHAVYYADGVRVPSPLTRPTCENCGEHVVRIMRPGRVSTVATALHQESRTDIIPAATAGPIPVGAATPRDHTAPREPHHWHLSDLLKPFHLHRK
ncbi:hypothetical protein ACFP1Z_18140 [Streptomyces gamaensis]|uniref:C2H2-type domain-containing protein n=1 Tax=Streptomyces gamaensis TaxID=1763542 RepID=A0ABW0Z3N2_9ACTN